MRLAGSVDKARKILAQLRRLPANAPRTFEQIGLEEARLIREAKKIDAFLAQ